MSDKADDILKELGKLKPSDMREVIENLAKQSGVDTSKLAHLPNRLSAEDIIERALISEQSFYWHINDGFFECYVDSRDALTKEDALKFAYDKQSNQPWYPTSFAYDPTSKIVNRVSAKEFREWCRRE